MQIENEHGFKRIAHLLSRYVAGVQTEKEERELYAWKGKEGGALFERLCAHVRERMEGEPEEGWEEAFARFERRRRNFQLKRRVRRWMSAAAVAAVACTGGYFGWERMQGNEQGGMELVAAAELDTLEAAPMLSSGSGGNWLLSEGGTLDYGMYDSLAAARGRAEFVDTLTVSVPECSEYHLVLEDGTEVWMNADSKMVYPARFVGNSREVKVEGEVYLEVAKDASRPFRVEAGGLKIEVLGTSFNVNTYEDVEVTLVSGAVRAEQLEGTAEWTLAPGQQLAATEAGVKVERVNVQDYICWREGTYIFKGERLEDIAKTLTRWYGKDVVFLEDGMKEKLFTGILDKGVGVDVFMRQLSESSGIKFVVSGNQLFIK